MLAFILYPEYVGIIPSSGLCICFSHCCGQFCIRSLHGCLLTVYVSGQVSSWKSPPCVTLSNAVAPFSNIPFQNYPVPLLYMATAAWDCFVCLLTCLECISQTRLQLPREKAWYFCSLLLPPVPGVLKKTWWIKTDTHPHTNSYPQPNMITVLLEKQKMKAEALLYLVREESMSSTNFAKCFLCFWIFGISTCGYRRQKTVELKCKINS